MRDLELFLHQLRSEQLVFWRSREAAIFIFVFPPLLFLLLGSVYGGDDIDGVPTTSYLLAGMLAYGVANTAFGGLAIQLVIRREYGILKRIRATPLPAPLYLGCVLLSNVIVFVLQAMLMLALGLALYGADGAAAPASLALVLCFGAVAMAGLGFGAAALIRSSEAVAAVVNVIVLPMSFLSGAFGSTDGYPAFLQAVSDVLPLTYFLDLTLAAYADGEGPWQDPLAVAVVIAWGAAGYLVAARRFAWEPRDR
jgi:ABC-2 type transport system permease protein